MTQLFFIAAGGLFAVVWTLAAGMLIAPGTVLPLTVRLSSGAAVLSATIFLLLNMHAGLPAVYIALGAATIAIAGWRIRRLTFTRLTRMKWWFCIFFAAYGLVYLIYAFAPEIQPDAITYHLGLVSEYVARHSFTDRLGFYEVLPQGVEMLFVPAFAIGGHSAAKLVHFSFLIATIPLLRHICAELGVIDSKACCAAALFFIAPVVAVTSTSAYTDAALVCCCCAVLYLLIRWDRERNTTVLILAALNAGFCYAIKPTFGWVALVTLGFVAYRSRKRSAILACVGGAATSIIPWMIRSAVLTRSPFAPFLNAWFPNTVFTSALEKSLDNSFSAFNHSFPWSTAFLDYTILGGNQGILGPAFLLAPLLFLALRNVAGRWLAVSSLLLAAPILANTGTRFLMPAASVASIALVSVLPVPAALMLAGVQVIGSANSFIDLYDKKNDWRLPEIPLRAALRLEPEASYLRRNIPDFANNSMIADVTPDRARIYALASVHQAYLPRQVLVYWQSALADRILDFLSLAYQSRSEKAQLLSWTWPARSYDSVKVTALADLRVLETQFETAVIPPPASAATPWTHLKAGDSFELRVTPDVTGADLLIWPDSTALAAATKHGQREEWQSLGVKVKRSGVAVDIRRDVTAWMRKSGYRYILVSTEQGAFAFLGNDMLEHPADWGVRPAARNGETWLFYITGQGSGS